MEPQGPVYGHALTRISQYVMVAYGLKVAVCISVLPALVSMGVMWWQK